MEQQQRRPDQTPEIQSTDKQVIVPVIEEQFDIKSKTVESGTVSVTKKVHQTVESVDIPVTNEHVNVDRVKINQYVDTAPPAMRQEGDTTIIPILKEVLVVEKKLLLVEEVRITRKQEKTSSTHQDILRKEEVIISRVNADPNQQ
ncbi:YsnF/AvaK domain-containing protein [Pedobacter sp. SYSU D00535]|uniref:YsnF/AvaK domain-containing protein n=1 Tax=Pedobacter sp. SYSU D00535 TaxID=2810308 RepID=UPI001A963E09|nr:YsnF/AvaK domain-containing protein [Pedobacter sp. SYSU D00535]